MAASMRCAAAAASSLATLGYPTIRPLGPAPRNEQSESGDGPMPLFRNRATRAQRPERRSRLWAASEDLVWRHLPASPACTGRPQAAPVPTTELGLLSVQHT